MKALIGLFITLGLSVAIAGQDTGGGTGFQKGLLDLALYNQNAFHDDTAGSKLPNTKALRLVGFDKLNNIESPILQKALAQVAKWQKSSPEVTFRITQALKAMPIYYATGTIRGSAIEFHLPDNSSIKSDDLWILGIYFPKLGNFTSKARFESLSEKNQIAYLIHESLRQEQISYGSHITNENIQKLTALVMTDPEPNITLDTKEYMLGSTFARKQELLLLSTEITTKACGWYGRFCNFNNSSADISTLPNAMSDFLDERRNVRKSLSQYNEQEIVREIELRSLISLLSATSIGIDLDDAAEPMFKVDRSFSFGVLDQALEDVNTKSNHNAKTLNFLKGIQQELIRGGLSVDLSIIK